ncbi:RNA helicase [Flavobacteriaceae bacterium UJ101]|nr:RNA helicase [Flavobacteriaceae bacterium UJ101]
MSSTFQELNLTDSLYQALEQLQFTTPTPIQTLSHKPILSGSDVIGIAQTGTGKTFAYLLPIIKNLKPTLDIPPKVIIMVPTRELVLQVVEEVEKLTQFNKVRVGGVYGGTNINTQKFVVLEGLDILVATPGRLYDLVVAQHLNLKLVRQFVIDEIDVMMDLGFRYQITNIMDLLPKTQNILFSATMTEEVENLIQREFKSPIKISVAKSGTPLENIEQRSYEVRNFYTKINLVEHLLSNHEEYSKVILFTAHKRMADLVYRELSERIPDECVIIHSNKSQNYRIRSIKQFSENEKRILISTDIIARGLDIDAISHVINFDTPQFPENYMHRIGRTGRAEKKGVAITLSTEKEWYYKEQIERLMEIEIPLLPFPEEVEITTKLTLDEKPRQIEIQNKLKQKKKKKEEEKGASFHEKKDKNKKVNLGGKYHREIKKKYKKAKTKGDKARNQRNKNVKRKYK